MKGHQHFVEFSHLLCHENSYASLHTTILLVWWWTMPLMSQVRLAYDVPPLHGPPTIAWEIQSIERLLERLENREMLKELVKQQRDIIYTNIATHASRRERYQMYNKWGIRKLSTGRLRKIVYGMLWKDAKRCAFSLIYCDTSFYSCIWIESSHSAEHHSTRVFEKVQQLERECGM